MSLDPATTDVLSDYTLIALQDRFEKDFSSTVTHYKRTELPKNMTLVEYTVEPTTNSPLTSVKTLLNYFTVKKYFDNTDEHFLGHNEKEASKKLADKIQQAKLQEARLFQQARELDLRREVEMRRAKIEHFKKIMGSIFAFTILGILWLTGQVSTFLIILVGHSITILLIITKRPLGSYFVQNSENSNEESSTSPSSVVIFLKFLIFLGIFSLIQSSPIVFLVGMCYGLNLGLMYLLNGSPSPENGSIVKPIVWTVTPMIITSFVSGSPSDFVGGVIMGALIWSIFEFIIVIHFIVLSTIPSKLLPTDLKDKVRPIIQFLVDNGKPLVLLLMTTGGSIILFMVPIVMPTVGLAKGFFKGSIIPATLFSFVLTTFFTSVLFSLQALSMYFS